MPLLLTEPDVRRHLRMADLIPLVRETLGRFSAGECVQPVRQSLAIRPAGGFYGVMPAHVPGRQGEPGALGLKSVGFFPGNAARGLPTHLAQVLLLDPATGALEAILDGRLITELRTAAASAVSVDLLARDGPTRLAILGSGVQARSHLEALALVRPLAHVRVWSRTADHALQFVRHHARRVSCPISAVATARDAVHDADVVVTVTSASEPILAGDWLAQGTHLAVVGSSSPRMREVDSATIRRARVWVDSRAAARVEAGDLLIPEREGAIPPQHVVGELGDVVLGRSGRQGAEEITLFKSLGIAVLDVATAQLVLARARAAGHGQPVDL
jgi:ornithine cyclodeaminase/alanine dehydrogenase-like protein (mu-crystallin family)